MTPLSRGLWKTVKLFFATPEQRTDSDFRDSWFQREEARQIKEVEERLERVRQQLASIDQRRVQRG
ncbi:MAG: hypothetical protein ABI665_03750 [Vicinamibacterales bacterium]